MTDKPTSLAWMPSFIKDEQALLGRLTTLQFGALRRLRLYAWAQSRPCTLPNDDTRLAQIAGLSVDEWAANRDAIREFFEPTDPDGEGRSRLIDHELEAIFAKQLGRYLSASNRGRMGGRPAKAGDNQPEKLGESSGLRGLRNHLDSVVSTSIHTTETEKAGEKPSLPERPISAELERQQKDWLASNPGKPLPLTFHLDRRPAPDRRQAAR